MLNFNWVKMKKTIFLSTIILLLTACQDYLETNPDSTFDVQIDSEDKIAELLAWSIIPRPCYFAFLEARTDNVGERTNGIHSRLNEGYVLLGRLRSGRFGYSAKLLECMLCRNRSG